MLLYHTEPCSECPWRKTSLQGYLGGHSPLMYADAVQDNEVPACHNQDNGPDCDTTAMCAGALSVISNACISPHRTDGGQEAKAIVGQRDDCFPHPREFFAYHTDGEVYQSPLMRRISAKR